MVLNKRLYLGVTLQANQAAFVDPRYVTATPRKFLYVVEYVRKIIMTTLWIKPDDRVLYITY